MVVHAHATVYNYKPINFRVIGRTRGKFVGISVNYVAKVRFESSNTVLICFLYISVDVQKFYHETATCFVEDVKRNYVTRK